MIHKNSKKYKAMKLKLSILKCAELCILYAENRANLTNKKGEIHSHLEKHNFEVDLSDYRISALNWYDGEWKGWIDALELGYPVDYTEEEMQLAKLLDEKKNIIAEAGRIKRKIYANGKSLKKLSKYKKQTSVDFYFKNT